MRNIDRDHGDIGLHELSRDGWRRGIVGLKLDHQVHLFPDQLIGVAHRGLGVVPVVNHHQFDVPIAVDVAGRLHRGGASRPHGEKHGIAVLPHLRA